MKVDKTTWEKKNIKTICTDIFDGDWIESKDQSNEGIRLVQTGNIGVGKYRDKIGRAKFISEQTFYELNCSEIYPGDVLVSRLPDPVGRACIVPTLDCRMITAVDCSILRFNKTIYRNKFFIYYTQSNSYSSCVERQSKGTTRKRISRKNLESISCPVPNLEEQDMIIAELDAIQAMIDGYREQLADLDRLAQSIFLDTFGDPISNPKGWGITNYEQEFKITSGGTPSKKIPEYWENGTIPWIGSNMCTNSILYETDGKTITQLGLDNSSAKIFPINTIIIALVGATIGKTSLLATPTATNQNVAGLTIKRDDVLTPIYGFYHTRFLYPLFQNIGEGKFTISNQGFIKKLPLCLPPLSLQQQFAEQVEAIERQKEAIRQQLVDAETLMAERMQYYFS